MVRLFLAVWPPDDLVEELRGLPRKDRPGLTWVRPENWHTTLRFLGDADPDEVADRLDRIRLPAAVARYGPAIDVLWQRTVVVPVAGLTALAAAVTTATGHIGTDAPRKRFVGHLTLTRIKRGGRVPAVIGRPVAAEQEVDEIALVASRLRAGGPDYETVATWRTS